MQSLHVMKFNFACALAEHTAFGDVARPDAGVEGGELGLRLDHDPPPAPLVEPAGHIVGDRVSCAHIDVETLPLIGEDGCEVIILEMLGVGQVHGRLRRGQA